MYIAMILCCAQAWYIIARDTWPNRLGKDKRSQDDGDILSDKKSLRVGLLVMNERRSVSLWRARGSTRDSLRRVMFSHCRDGAKHYPL